MDEEIEPGQHSNLVGAHLERLLASPSFQKAPQVSAFLRFVVVEAIEGRAEKLNAYSVGTLALGRPAEFDPLVDPLVRVTARRVRQALAQHYQDEPPDLADPLRIELPVGGYAPRVTRAGAARRTRSPQQAGGDISVEPTLRRLLGPHGSIAAAIVAALMIGAAIALPPRQADRWVIFDTGAIPAPATGGPALLAPPALQGEEERRVERYFPRLKLAAAQTGASIDPRQRELLEASARLIVGRFDDMTLLSRGSTAAADYLLSIELIEIQDSTWLFASLERSDPGVVVWSGAYDKIEADKDLSELIGAALAPILSPYGVLYADVAERADDAVQFDCIATAYRYFDQESWALRLEAQRCLEALVDSGVRHPTVFALKAYLHIDAYRSSVSSEFDGPAPLERALAAAQEAVKFAPGSARAHQAMFDVLKVAGRHEAARRASEKAQAANPYDLDVLTDVAGYLITRGMLDEATPLLERARRLALREPAWLKAYEAIHAWRSDDRVAAERFTAALEPEQSTLGAVMLTILAHERGDREALKRFARVLLVKEPKFADEPVNRFLRRGFSDQMARALGEGLREALKAAKT